MGREFAKEVHGGSVLALRGEMGSGKTLFTKGLVAGFGISRAVSSPTFSIVHEYRGEPLSVYHFDFFRLENLESATRLGLDEYFLEDAVSIIEWADRFPELVPKHARWISFQINSECRRTITLTCSDENPCA